MTLDEAIENARKVTNSCRKPLMAFETMNSIVKDNYREENEQLAQWLEELKEYKELEEKLCVIFAGDCNLSDVVENLERQITEPNKDHPVNARILTYEDAEKWNEYRELEEQGRLLKLPCKIGDAVYFIKNNGNACFTCEHLDRNYHKFDWCKNETITENGQKYINNPQYHKTPLCSKQFYEIRKIYMQSVPHILDYKKEFGNTIFLSKKEAEAKLKEMEKIPE